MLLFENQHISHIFASDLTQSTIYRNLLPSETLEMVI